MEILDRLKISYRESKFFLSIGDDGETDPGVLEISYGTGKIDIWLDQKGNTKWVTLPCPNWSVVALFSMARCKELM